MGRKKRASGAEELMDVVALFPWWVGVMLAFASWLVMHIVAGTTPDAKAFQPGQMAGPIVRTAIASFANVFQYILPLICLMGAVVSCFRRRKRVGLVMQVSLAKSSNPLLDMTWREFEMLVGEAFRMQGYSVAENPRPGADGGVDLALRKHGELTLVQCKQWKAFKVDVITVRELYGVMAARGASAGYVVTSGTFTEPAIEFARGRNVRLIDGGQLLGMVLRARASLDAAKTGVQPDPWMPEVSATGRPQGAPACPGCGSAMVLRTARQGANAGSSFWGCSRYPNCKGTRPR